MQEGVPSEFKTVMGLRMLQEEIVERYQSPAGKGLSLGVEVFLLMGHKSIQRAVWVCV